MLLQYIMDVTESDVFLMFEDEISVIPLVAGIRDLRLKQQLSYKYNLFRGKETVYIFEWSSI